MDQLLSSCLLIVEEGGLLVVSLLIQHSLFVHLGVKRIVRKATCVPRNCFANYFSFPINIIELFPNFIFFF